MLFRGQEFRTEFSNLSTLKSLFPGRPMLALTATAPPGMIKSIITTLQMNSPTVISVNPNRGNIYLEKHLKLDTYHGMQGYDDILLPIAKELQIKGIDYPQTIIYTKLKYCGYGYKLFSTILGEKQFGSRERKPSNSLIVQFHSPQTTLMKKEILQEIKNENSKIRIIFATSALGMGVNAPYIENVIHIGPPSSLEQYMQEFGRSGRSGQHSRSVLYYSNSEISIKKIKSSMMDNSMACYCESNSVCLRKFILDHFGYGTVIQNRCCSVCHPDLSALTIKTQLVSTVAPDIARSITDTELDILSKEFDNLLADYDIEQTKEHFEYAMFLAHDSSEELSNKLFTILENIHIIKYQSCLKKYKIYNDKMAVDLFSLIEKYSTAL